MLKEHVVLMRLGTPEYMQYYALDANIYSAGVLHVGERRVSLAPGPIVVNEPGVNWEESKR